MAPPMTLAKGLSNGCRTLHYWIHVPTCATLEMQVCRVVWYFRPSAFVCYNVTLPTPLDQ
jgi:hypothetical protein